MTRNIKLYISNNKNNDVFFIVSKYNSKHLSDNKTNINLSDNFDFSNIVIKKGPRGRPIKDFINMTYTRQDKRVLSWCMKHNNIYKSYSLYNDRKRCGKKHLYFN
jgi:hypothetical protein